VERGGKKQRAQITLRIFKVFTFLLFYSSHLIHLLTLGAKNPQKREKGEVGNKYRIDSFKTTYTSLQCPLCISSAKQKVAVKRIFLNIFKGYKTWAKVAFK